MSATTSIEWTDSTWNPMRGCSRVSAGCQHCYAERFSSRFSWKGGRYDGLVRQTRDGPRWTGKVELVESELERTLKWRKPKRIFLNSMSDTFHESLPDEAIDRVFAVMALAPQHTFQVLTKRPERMRKYLSDEATAGRVRNIRASNQWTAREDWPLPQVWCGVSVEDQATADERIPLLLSTPAAKRFVSYEPALGPVDFTELDGLGIFRRPHSIHEPAVLWNALTGFVAGPGEMRNHLEWVIVGGESGPGARPFNPKWARQTLAACRDARVTCFVKQLGSNVVGSRDPNIPGADRLRFEDSKGGEMSEWPEDLRVREIPGARP